jgi:GntR family transcriptional regulator
VQRFYEVSDAKKNKKRLAKRYGVVLNYITRRLAMDRDFNDSQPIYRQLRDRVVAMILEQVLKEGDPLPSVRTVAAEYRVNPLTVLKAYQQLADDGLVETRRGRGMFINQGARKLLMAGERERFLAEEWPRVRATMERLGLTLEDLLKGGR